MAKKKEDLERQLGRLAFKIGKKQQEAQRVGGELQKLQAETNAVATKIEKLNGK